MRVGHQWGLPHGPGTFLGRNGHQPSNAGHFQGRGNTGRTPGSVARRHGSRVAVQTGDVRRGGVDQCPPVVVQRGQEESSSVEETAEVVHSTLLLHEARRQGRVSSLLKFVFLKYK